MHGSLLSVRFKYHSTTILLADFIACRYLVGKNMERGVNILYALYVIMRV